MKEVAEFAGVWKHTVIRVYQQWHKSSLQKTLLRIVTGKSSTKSGPTAQFLDARLAKHRCGRHPVLVQYKPDPITAVIGAHGGTTHY